MLIYSNIDRKISTKTVFIGTLPMAMCIDICDEVSV